MNDVKQALGSIFIINKFNFEEEEEEKSNILKCNIAVDLSRQHMYDTTAYVDCTVTLQH